MELLKVFVVFLAIVAVAFTETTPEAVCSMQCELGFQCILTTEGPTCQATCEVIDCRDGMICIMDQVQCKREPCPPRPICVPTEKVSERKCLLKCEAGYNCVYGPFNNSVCAPTCAVQKCAEDQKCVMKQLRQCLVEPCPPDPVCVPIAEEPECPLQCESGYYCVYGGPFNKSRCAPTCAVKECPEDQKCVMKQLRQCFAPPCPPDPVCVPKTEDPEPECPLKCDSGYYCVSGPFHSICAPTCAVKKCTAEQKCTMKQLRVCVMAPCPPIPTCVPLTEDSENPEGITN